MPGGLKSPIFSCHKLKCFGSDISVQLLSHLSCLAMEQLLSVRSIQLDLSWLMNNTAAWKCNLFHILGIRYNSACWFTAQAKCTQVGAQNRAQKWHLHWRCVCECVCVCVCVQTRCCPLCSMNLRAELDSELTISSKQTSCLQLLQLIKWCLLQT